MSGSAIHVVSVVSLPFSGSTLLTIMLDSHPQICGGGEIYSLVEDTRLSTNCSVCGRDCPYWTEANKRAIRKEDFYTFILAIFSNSIIVDSSKKIEWFEKATQFPSSVPIRFVPVLMVKHPVRQLYSLFTSMDLSDMHWMQRALYPFFTNPDLLSFIGPIGRKISTAVRRFLMHRVITYIMFRPTVTNKEKMSAVFTDEQILTLRYEDLVIAPEATLKPLLQRIGLKYVDAIQDCYEEMHHNIGGNSGTTQQLHKNIDGISKAHKANLEYFINLRGIKMDNAYLNFFTKDDLAWLSRHPLIHRLCRMFNYPLAPDKDK